MHLFAVEGTLRFLAAGSNDPRKGDYAMPFQMLSCLRLEPSVSVSHDALSLFARHGVILVADGRGGVCFYASMPTGQDSSAHAERQVLAWADLEQRIKIARRMNALLLGEILPATDLVALRGLEHARARATYKHLAQ